MVEVVFFGHQTGSKGGGHFVGGQGVKWGESYIGHVLGFLQDHPSVFKGQQGKRGSGSEAFGQFFLDRATAAVRRLLL